MDVILKVENLSKHFKEIKAVDNISFEVRRGSLFAFLGPNGAGKSTTINIITKLLAPDTGKIYLNNKTDKSYFRNKIGVVFQGNVLDDNLTVKENLITRGSLYLNDNKLVKERYDFLSNYLNIKEFENQRFKTLSGGQKRRAEIARALFSNPEILLLDEPTTGLDPETRKLVWKVIEDLQKNKNMTIFLTTHYMEEAANADHVVIINKGKIVAEGTPNKLKETYSKDNLKVVPKNKKKLVSYLEENKINYKKVSDQYIIPVENSKIIIKIIKDIEENIHQFEVIKGSMDDVFLTVVGGEHHV